MARAIEMSRRQEARYLPMASRCSSWRAECVSVRNMSLRSSVSANHFEPIFWKEKITTNGSLLVIDILTELLSRWLKLK